MILFVLAYDVLIRYISFKLVIIERDLFAYCDDLAIATHDMIRLWKQLAPLLAIIAACTLLKINNSNEFYLDSFLVNESPLDL